VLTTITRSQGVLVQEISCTGAKLEGDNLPEVGEVFVLKIGHLRAFATVEWQLSKQCGVSFDIPLSEFQIRHLRRAGRAGSVTRHLVEGEQAYEDWQTGFAR
jgi:hypothetical protein